MPDAYSDVDPIDITQTIAEAHDWEFDRIGDDQIALAVEGRWRSYQITLAHSEADETLRLIATFELDPGEARLPPVLELMNLVNDSCWAGAFTWWSEEKMIVWRYGLVLSGQQAAPEQIDAMISIAVTACERFYPAFQLVGWGDKSPAEAMHVAIAEAYGTA
jgi:hypothetical protein